MKSRAPLAAGAALLWVSLGLIAGAAGEPATGSSAYPGMRVTAISVGRECFEDLIPASGVLVAVSEISVRPERDGLMIGDVLVEPGDKVEAGRTLAHLVGSGSAPTSIAMTAPVPGTVVAINATVGAYASPAANAPMFRLLARGELEMKGQVLASAMPRLKVGQSAAIDIMGLQRLNGRVDAIERTIDPLSQLGTVRIALVADPRLRLGAYARAQVDAGSHCDVAVPLSSILYGKDGAVVEVVADSRVATRHVGLGITAPGGSVQILSGLSEGEIVIVRAAGFLREGDRVQALVQSIPLP